MLKHLSLECAVLYHFVAPLCSSAFAFMYVCFSPYMPAQTTCALIAGLGVNGECGAHRGIEFVLMAWATPRNPDGVY